MNQPTKTVKTTTQGIITALVAFLLWGNFPLYFKELSHYDAIEVIVHRVVWTFVLLLIVLMLSRRTAWLGVIRHQPKWLGITFIAALLIGTNWLTYVWAVTHDQVLEASLGYFINPLMGVGNIRAENLKNAIIGLSTGDFEAKNIDGFQKVNLNLGSIKISNSKNISIIKLGTGDITLDIIEQNRDFLIENGMGDVDLNINNMFDGKIETHVGLGDIRETNMKANGNKYNGTVELGTGDLSIEGVDYNGKEIN